MRFDALILGGGAAGLFCARTAGTRGRRVLLIEHQARLGNKILISGGGRCNFTNLGATAANYATSGSPHFAKSALARFTPDDFLALVEQRGIEWEERKHRQLFGVRSSRQILELLERDCGAAGVEVRTGCIVTSVRRGDLLAWPSRGDPPGEIALDAASPADWVVSTSQGTFTAASLVIATGGLSFPRLGATSFGHDLARQFGLNIIAPRPGLVPLIWSPEDLAVYGELAGLSITAEVGVEECPDRFLESVLFTHRGLSGPAILQASNYWLPGKALHVDLLPGGCALDLLNANRTGGRDVRSALRGRLPERLLQRWCARHAPSRPIAQLAQRELETVARQLHAWAVTPAGDEGYPKAEVTLGGVDTAELSSRTMECRRIAGLYFIGEVVDVTGWLGGYNFQWAWAGGHAAGEAV